MSTVVIANPVAGAGRFGRAWRKWQGPLEGAFGPLELLMTRRPGEATSLVRQALARGAKRIAVAGGDGSLNECVNGFFDETGAPIATDAVLVPLPLGTGGDFARSIGMSGVDVPAALGRASVRAIDLGRAELTTVAGAPLTRHFVNISSFGSSGLVVDLVNKTTKRFGAKASFLIGTVKALWAYENQRVRLRIDDSFDELLPVLVVAVANGRYFGGAMKIAPEAHLDDGAFDVTVVGDLGLIDFLRISPKLYAGKHIGLPHIRSFRGRVVTAEPQGSSPVLIDLDGEQPGKLPVRYSIVPKALKVLAPWDTADAR
jgi:diacylglycerol kinase (ATP)